MVLGKYLVEVPIKVHIIKWLKRSKKKKFNLFLPQVFHVTSDTGQFSFPAFSCPFTNTLELLSPAFVSWEGQEQGLPGLAPTTLRPSATQISTGDTPAPQSRTNPPAADQGRRIKLFPSYSMQQRHEETRGLFTFRGCVNTQAITGCLQLRLHRDLPRPDPALIPHCSSHPNQMQEPRQDQALN